MGGRRRDFDGQFAVAEIGFWMTDPRVQGTSAAFKVYLHYAWMIAVKERREQLPTWWDTASITRAAGLDHRTGQKCARLAVQKCLHSVSDDGRITVCGVKSKHPNLTWKDEPINEGIATHKRRQTESETQTELKEETEGGKPRKKTRAPTPENADAGKLIKHWCEVFKTSRGRSYVVRPVDSKHAKLIIGAIGLAEAEKAVGRILASPEPFLLDKADLKILYSQLNAFTEDNHNDPRRSDFESPVQRVVRETREAAERVG